MRKAEAPGAKKMKSLPAAASKKNTGAATKPTGRKEKQLNEPQTLLKHHRSIEEEDMGNNLSNILGVDHSASSEERESSEERSPSWRRKRVKRRTNTIVDQR